MRDINLTSCHLVAFDTRFEYRDPHPVRGRRERQVLLIEQLGHVKIFAYFFQGEAGILCLVDSSVPYAVVGKAFRRDYCI